jgi:hypothetical protein
VTHLPDDVLAALAAEPTLLANPGAEVFDTYNGPAVPMSPAEFAATIEKVMQDMWNTPTRWHGSAANPHITWPGGHICGECGEDVSMLLAAQRGSGDGDA